MHADTYFQGAAQHLEVLPLCNLRHTSATFPITASRSLRGGGGGERERDGKVRRGGKEDVHIFLRYLLFIYIFFFFSQQLLLFNDNN